MLEAFDEDLNRRFAVEPAEVKDLHQCLPKGLDLADVFVWESPRTVHNDWSVAISPASESIASKRTSSLDTAALFT